MTEEEAIAIARVQYVEPSDNDIEIDDNPQVSVGNDGIWVQAWVFVPNP